MEVSGFLTLLQSYNNENSTILAQKQTHRPMQQNRIQPPSQLWLINLLQTRQEYSMQKGSLFNKWSKIMKLRLFSYTIYKSKLKMD